jgi:predicted nuclease with TOPRIM domain
MNTQITLLEGKVEHLLRLVSRLRHENALLNEELLSRETEISQLRETLTGTRTRIEQLVISIPDDEAPQ